MNPITDAALGKAVDGLREVLSGDVLAGLSDEDRAVVLRRLGEIGRLTDAVTVEAVACADVEFGHRFGCSGMNELLQRALLTDAASAGKTIRVAAAVRRDVSLSSGDRLPAKWPLLREVLLDGVIGVAGVLAAIGPLEA
ncbi:hypothetical protein ACI3KS_17915, partial [Microbacterium sp. ZW T5_45]|uniref:hypothetical protein n=1 Tax=Microbacterium sp. ZW T5_45 TaxID=3378080 RepID=UPI003851ABA3